jgi:hypothetical protein
MTMKQLALPFQTPTADLAFSTSLQDKDENLTSGEAADDALSHE